MPRNFDGTNDEIRTSIGACTQGYGTLAAIIKRGANTAWHAIIGLHNSANASQFALEITDTNLLHLTNATVDSEGATSVLTTSGWVFIAAGKSTGSSTPRFHIYQYSTNTWTHEDGSLAIGDGGSVSGGTVRFGEWEDVDDFNGAIEVAAMFPSNLSDAEIEQLPFSLNSWFAYSPLGLWTFDQSLVTNNIYDWTGNGANQTTITGTTVLTTGASIFTLGGKPLDILINTGVIISANIKFMSGILTGGKM